MSDPFIAGAPVIAYLRDSGGDEQDLSISQQLEAIQRWCQAAGHPLSRTFIDEARTASSTTGRDAFIEMIYYFREQPPIAGLVIWNHRRFARNYNDAQGYKAEIRRRGYTIHSLNDNFPEGTDGLMYEGLYDWMAEKKLEETSYEARRGLYQYVEKFGCVPGNPPRGLMRQPVDLGTRRDGSPHVGHKWVPDPETSPLVQTAFRLRAAGKTVAQIQQATQLYKSRNSYTTFFRNQIYIGTLVFGPLTIENYCDPIIDPATWDAVQSLQRQHKKDQQLAPGSSHHPRRVSSSFLLSGLLHCARCKAPMSGHKSKQRNGSYYLRYECTNAKRRAGCEAKRIPAKSLETTILQYLVDELITETYLATVETTYAQQYQTILDENQAQQTALQRTLGKTRRQIGHITTAIAESGHSSALLESLKQLETQQNQITTHLAELQAQQHHTPAPLDRTQLPQMTTTLHHKLTTAPLAERRTLLQGLLEKITVQRLEKTFTGHIHLYYPPRPHPDDIKKKPDIITVPTYRAPVGAYARRHSIKIAYTIKKPR